MARPALSATRAIEVVNFLAAHPTESFTLSDLAARLGVNVASMHAVLAALTETGYLTRHTRHRTYTLGPALVGVGAVALERNPAISAAREEARRLGDSRGLDVAVTARAGDDLAFVARTGIRHVMGSSLFAGERVQLRPPLGSIYHAWATPAAIDEWLAAVPPDERAFDRQVLEVIADRGYSVTIDAATADEPGTRTQHLLTIDPDASYLVSSISGPVFDTDGDVVLAINFVGFPGPQSGVEVVELGNAVRDAALLVTRQTRGRVPDTFTSMTDPGTVSSR